MGADLRPEWRPGWAVHPGDLLVEALEERTMSQAELARRMGRPIKTINEIVKHKQAITPETALQLETVLRIPAHFWINLQSAFDEKEARRRVSDRLAAELSWLHRFPIAVMAKRGWISRFDDPILQLQELLSFFGVASPEVWRQQWASAPASFRQSGSFRSKPEAVSAWLRQAERRAEVIACEPYNEAVLKAALPKIRAMTKLDVGIFLPQLETLLATCGVALVVVPELPGTHLSGATRWIGTRKALVALSLRHKTDDHFWFALFHELGHVLAGRNSHLDDARPEERLQAIEEAEADQFASRQLVPDETLAELEEPYVLGPELIRDVAARLGISPGIVVGRLEHKLGISPARFRYLKRTWTWAE